MGVRSAGMEGSGKENRETEMTVKNQDSENLNPHPPKQIPQIDVLCVKPEARASKGRV